MYCLATQMFFVRASILGLIVVVILIPLLWPDPAASAAFVRSTATFLLRNALVIVPVAIYVWWPSVRASLRGANVD